MFRRKNLLSGLEGRKWLTAVFWLSPMVLIIGFWAYVYVSGVRERHEGVRLLGDINLELSSLGELNAALKSKPRFKPCSQGEDCFDADWWSGLVTATFVGSSRVSSTEYPISVAIHRSKALYTRYI